MDKNHSGKMWAVIVLLTTLNLQHIDLKTETKTLGRKVGAVEGFLAKKFKSFKQGE